MHLELKVYCLIPYSKSRIIPFNLFRCLIIMLSAEDNSSLVESTPFKLLFVANN